MQNVWNETLDSLRKDPSYRNMFHMMERFGGDTAAEMTDRNGKEIKRTYREYIDMSYSACGNLQAALPGEDTKIVGLLYDTCMDWPVLMWGILMSGNIPLLLNPALNPKVLDTIMKEAGAETYVAAGKNDGIEGTYIPAEDILKPGRPGEEKWGPYVALCTSGTTGSSRIFLYDGFTIASHILSFDEAKKINPDMPFIEDKPCKLLAFLPFHHVFGFSVVYVLYSCTGKTLVYMKDKSVDTILGTCRKHGVTHLYCIPMFFNALANGIVKKMNGKDIHSLSFIAKQLIKQNTLGTKIRSMITGGGHVPESTLDVINAVGYPLVNGFGMTETGIIAVERSLDPAQRVKGSIGIPFTLTEWKIESDGGEEGELLIRGDALYTASIIDGKIVPRDRLAWFATGDVVVRKPDGLYITGRCKDVIIGASGENIYPEELEDAFAGISGVKSYCIMGMKDGSSEKVVMVIEPDPSADKNEILENARRSAEKLTASERPVKAFFSQKALPVSGSLKIQRQLLKKQIEDGSWICEVIDIYSHEAAAISAGEENSAVSEADDSRISGTENSQLSEAEHFVASEAEIDPEFRRLISDIKNVIASELDMETDRIGEEDHFINVLGADSLDIYGIFVILEEKYGIEIEQDEMLKLENVRKTARLVYDRIHASSKASS